jgi:diaminopimelate epimerase
MPAGSVQIELKKDNFVVMIGPVDVCYSGYFPVK